MGDDGTEAEHTAGNGDGTPPRSAIVRRTIAPDPTTAEYELVELIAELEGTSIEELPSLYTQVDHFVETLFQNPPAHEAQVQVRFSYAGYRVTIDQEGQVTVVPVKESTGED